MQVNGTRVLTYADFVKGLDPKGNFAHRIVELVAKKSRRVVGDGAVTLSNTGTGTAYVTASCLALADPEAPAESRGIGVAKAGECAETEHIPHYG